MVRETLVTANKAELERLLDGEVDSLRLNESLDAPQSTPIAECYIGNIVTCVGVVTDVGERNTFTRDDGTDGQVRNIQIQDRTGMIAIALWGDYADRSIEVGDTVQVMDAEVEEGFDDPTQLNVGYDARLRVFDQDRNAELVTLTLEDT